jgi:hypothetical protein
LVDNDAVIDDDHEGRAVMTLGYKLSGELLQRERERIREILQAAEVTEHLDPSGRVWRLLRLDVGRPDLELVR